MDTRHFVILECRHLANGCVLKCGCIGLMLFHNLSCLRMSRDCLCVSVAAGRRGFGGVWVCGCVCLWVCGFVSLRCFIFGDVLRCPHKHIVTIAKVYIARNNTLGNNTIPYKLARLVTFESLKWKYSFTTNVRCRYT